MAELIKKTDNLNQGREKLNEAIKDAETAKGTSAQADDKATEALAKSESTQTQLDTIVIEGDSSVEAAQARVDEKGESHTTLKARIDDGFTSVTSQLAETTTKLSNFPRLTDEADDTERFKRAISHANNNKNTLIMDETIHISETIYLPDNLKLIGYNTTIFTAIVNGTGVVIDGENVEITGNVFDGTEVTRRLLHVKNKNINIKDSVFKNAYSDYLGSYGIHVDTPSKNVVIEKCEFYNIKSEENGVVGDSLGSARGILFGDVEGCVSRLNDFDDIGGFEDGDCIQVQAIRDNTNITIEQNIFNNVTKRAVKLQGNGCTVRGNKIYSEFEGEGNDCPHSGITDFGSNNIIEGNTIKFLRSYTCIDVQSTKTKIENNYLENDIAGNYITTGARGSVTSCIIFGGASDLEIKSNTFQTTGRKLYAVTTSADIKIKDNFFSGGINYYVDFTNTRNVQMIDNEFRTGETTPNDMLRLRDITNFTISGNQFERATNFVRFFGTIDGVFILPNTFKEPTNNKYRTTDVTTGIESIKIIGDYAAGSATIPPGETSVSVQHNLGRDPVSAIASQANNFTPYRVRKSAYFITIEIPEPLGYDSLFYWRAE